MTHWYVNLELDLSADERASYGTSRRTIFAALWWMTWQLCRPGGYGPYRKIELERVTTDELARRFAAVFPLPTDQPAVPGHRVSDG